MVFLLLESRRGKSDCRSGDRRHVLALALLFALDSSHHNSPARTLRGRANDLGHRNRGVVYERHSGVLAFKAFVDMRKVLNPCHTSPLNPCP